MNTLPQARSHLNAFRSVGHLTSFYSIKCLRGAWGLCVQLNKLFPEWATCRAPDVTRNLRKNTAGTPTVARVSWNIPGNFPGGPVGLGLGLKFKTTYVSPSLVDALTRLCLSSPRCLKKLRVSEIVVSGAVLFRRGTWFPRGNPELYWWTRNLIKHGGDVLRWYLFVVPLVLALVQ